MCVFGLFLIIGHVAHAQNSQADYVNAHNDARRQVGVANVVWDKLLLMHKTMLINARVIVD